MVQGGLLCSVSRSTFEGFTDQNCEKIEETLPNHNDIKLNSPNLFIRNVENLQFPCGLKGFKAKQATVTSQIVQQIVLRHLTCLRNFHLRSQRLTFFIGGK